MVYLLHWLILFVAGQGFYHTSNGRVKFESKSAAENITATSNELRGIIDSRKNTFRFSVALTSFHGFNSSLQKQHYDENYVESALYPDAVFEGKIIEDVDYSRTGIANVRAKGKFSLHGISLIKLIPAKITISNNKQLIIQSNFILSLSDYNIKVPRIVHNKVAKDIQISLTASMNFKP